MACVKLFKSYKKCFCTALRTQYSRYYFHFYSHFRSRQKTTAHTSEQRVSKWTFSQRSLSFVLNMVWPKNNKELILSNGEKNRNSDTRKVTGHVIDDHLARIHENHSAMHKLLGSVCVCCRRRWRRLLLECFSLQPCTTITFTIQVSR